MINIAAFYHHGWGLPKDEQLAKEWEEKVIQTGDARAFLDLAFCHARKSMLAHEPDKVLYFLKKAAEGDNIIAQVLLGLYYAGETFKGDPIPLDPEQSRFWLEKGFHGGERGAATQLGKLYYYGIGGYPRDLVKARDWLEQTSDSKFTKNAKYLLATIYWSGTQDMLPDKDKAVALFRKSAEQGDAYAQFAMGQLYRGGLIGDKPDMAQALAWYRQSAKKYVLAVTTLGLMYWRGDGVAADPKQAVALLRAAAQAEERDAMYWLGILYQEGLGVEKNPAEARARFLQGAEAGDPRAMVKLSLDLFDGKGGPQELSLAVHWAKKAAEKGLNFGYCWAGTLLHFGVGTPPDPEQSRTWLRQGSDTGLTLCNRALQAESAHAPSTKETIPPLVHAVAGELSQLLNAAIEQPYPDVSFHLNVL
ncbi:MAG: sel1 repeat family protein [Magnetococcales bacterium]|nr:sel1 repeat family protein [Magnetococcales bacterium]